MRGVEIDGLHRYIGGEGFTEGLSSTIAIVMSAACCDTGEYT